MSAPALATAQSREFEFAFSKEEFSEIARILYADAGIALAEHKMPLVYGRLVKRLRVLGLESFKAYCAHVGSKGGAEERQAMMSALTTNVTRFLREPHHFEHLRTVTLPPLLSVARAGERVRVWSAGCSSGQEPYSIAMTILNLMPDAGERDVRILASDIDPHMIATARAGRYAEEDMTEIPRGDRGRWFDPGSGPDEKIWTANQAMRGLIAFRELNLMGPWPMKNRFDVIFCRNVVIYFDAETQARIWSRYAAALRPRGLLCIGHSERLSGPAKEGFQSVGATMYTRMETAR